MIHLNFQDINDNGRNKAITIVDLSSLTHATSFIYRRIVVSISNYYIHDTERRKINLDSKPNIIDPQLLQVIIFNLGK